MKNPIIYLDNNATTAVDPLVYDEMLWALKEGWGNPSSTHHIGQVAKKKLTECKLEAAAFFGVRPSELFFTSGATEALNTAIRSYFFADSSGHIVTSSLEHEAVYQTCRWLEKKGGEVTYLSPYKGEGAVHPLQVLEAVRRDTRLISLIWANNETGALLDLEKIANFAQEREIPLLIDGVAFLGKENYRLPAGVTAACFSSHKIHGPKGVGALIFRPKKGWVPLISGGPQEEGKRGGTENVMAIVGFVKALKLLKEKQQESINQMRVLRDLFEEQLLLHNEGVAINFRGLRVCNTTNICFEGVGGETLLIALDRLNIAASHGAACSSGALEPSRVLLNMGISKEKASQSLRFSFSRMNTKEEILLAVKIITQILASLRGFYKMDLHTSLRSQS
jgi:cysteine desulfurase